jgi:hypothetical protein
VGPGAVFGFTVAPDGRRTDVMAVSAANQQTLWTADAAHMLDNAKLGWMVYAGGLVYIAASTTDCPARPDVRPGLEAHLPRPAGPGGRPRRALPRQRRPHGVRSTGRNPAPEIEALPKQRALHARTRGRVGGTLLWRSHAAAFLPRHSTVRCSTRS